MKGILKGGIPGANTKPICVCYSSGCQTSEAYMNGFMDGRASCS